jgi:DNA modification methylase
MGRQKADMVFTDPPYGVGYTGGAKKRDALAGDQIGTTIYQDALPHLIFAASDKAALYLWYADAHAAAAAAAAAAAGYVITAQIIWVKNNAQFVSSAHYKGKHEPCYYAHRKGKSAAWYGANNEVTVWEANRAHKNEFHPTQKPVELAVRAIQNSSKLKDNVLDMFLGSGTTMIACEQLGRKCYGMEISPGYVAVAIERWQQFTGKSAVLIETGQTYDEVKNGGVHAKQ